MTRIAARKQARRFFGTMGAATRRTSSRSMEVRRNDGADGMIRRLHGYPEDRGVGFVRELMAR